MVKKQSKEVSEKPTRNGIPVSGVAGIALLFVSVSIGYANYMVYFGTNDLISKIMLVPSTLFVVVFLVYKALK